MIIAIQIAVNPAQPGWEAELASAAQEIWAKTGTTSKALIAFSSEAANKLASVAIGLEVQTKTVA